MAFTFSTDPKKRQAPVPSIYKDGKTPPEETASKVNIFNAQMGASFKCCSCGRNHHKTESDWAMINCLDNGVQKLLSCKLSGIFGAPLDNNIIDVSVYSGVNRNGSGRYRDESVAQLIVSTKHRFHPWLLLMPANYRRVQIVIKKNDMPKIRGVLASNDFASSFLTYLKLNQWYQDFAKIIQETKTLLSTGRFDFRIIPFDIRSSSIARNRMNEDVYGGFSLFEQNQISEFYSKITGFDYTRNNDTEEKTFAVAKDSVYMITDPSAHGIRTLFRVSLTDIHLPKFGVWKNLKEALALEQHSWQSIGKINY